MLGRAEDLTRRPVLHRAARVHDEHRVGRLGDHTEVVGDQDDTHVELVLDLLDQLEDLRLHRHVEGGRRLVGDQDRRPVHERHRDHRPLAHAAGELMRKVPSPIGRVGDADLAQELDGLFLRDAVRHVRVSEDSLGDLVADAVHRVKAREGILEDHRDVLAAQMAHVVGRERQDVASVEERLARHVRALAVVQPHQREARDGLSGARLANDAERLAPVERVGEIGDRTDVALVRGEDDRQVANIEDDLAHSYRTRGSRNA